MKRSTRLQWYTTVQPSTGRGKTQRVRNTRHSRKATQTESVVQSAGLAVVFALFVANIVFFVLTLATTAEIDSLNRCAGYSTHNHRLENCYGMPVDAKRLSIAVPLVPNTSFDLISAVAPYASDWHVRLGNQTRYRAPRRGPFGLISIARPGVQSWLALDGTSPTAVLTVGRSKQLTLAHFQLPALPPQRNDTHCTYYLCEVLAFGALRWQRELYKICATPGGVSYHVGRVTDAAIRNNPTARAYLDRPPLTTSANIESFDLDVVYNNQVASRASPGRFATRDACTCSQRCDDASACCVPVRHTNGTGLATEFICLATHAKHDVEE